MAADPAVFVEQHALWVADLAAALRDLVVAENNHDTAGMAEFCARYHAGFAMQTKRSVQLAAGGPCPGRDDRVVPPPVFFVAEHEHPVHGRLLAAVLGTETGPEAVASVRYRTLWLSMADRGHEVVSECTACPCDTLRLGRPTPCRWCRGQGWIKRLGRPMLPLGTPVAVLAIQPPSDPAHLAHYDAVVAGQERERT
jgi:hypothetical protein